MLRGNSGDRAGLWLFLAGAVGAGCSPDTWEAQTEHDGSVQQSSTGALLSNSHGGLNGGLSFIASRHQHGEARAVSLLDLRWGRLVDVYDFDSATQLRTLRLRDVLVGEAVGGDEGEFELVESLASGAEQLTIRHPFGSPQFEAALASAQSECGRVEDRSFDPRELPPFSRVPRNAVLALDFDDLLDESSVHRASVSLVQGENFDQAVPSRVWAAASHGGDVNGRFHSTRVLIDPRDGGSRVGLPAARTTARANVGVRIATIAGGASSGGLLRNLSGATLSTRASGSSDLSSSRRDVVRAFRSGGPASSTGDAFAGFMADTTPPRLVLDVSCTLTKVTHPAGAPADEFDVLVRFSEPGCALRRRPGDVITTSTHLAEVLSATPTFTRVRVLQGSPGSFARSVATYTAPWTTWLGQNLACALEFSPAAGAPLAQQVAPTAAVRVRFNEAIEPSSVRPFDSFRIVRPGAAGLETFVVGEVLADADLRGFSFQPQLPLSHAQGAAEVYRVDLNGARITDLAGNALADDPPLIDFALAANAPTQLTGGVVLRFDGPDEDSDGRADVRGQVLYDIVHGTLRPRNVARFSAPVDASQPLVSVMVPLAVGIQGPLSRYGSRSMNVWRYADMGMSLRDEAGHNLDVEGLWWRPHGGAVIADSFPQFQMALAHSQRVPDEVLDAGLLPSFPTTGLVSTFASNHDSGSGEPLTVVHSKASGYVVNPADVTTGASGLAIAPWPLNRGIPQPQFAYWTWRDTSKQVVGGPGGVGVPLAREVQVLGSVSVTKGFYPANQAPTIGLPLLTDIRTYPAAQANGTNAFSIAIAINSSARPFFRAHSTGGVNATTGATKIVDPDSALIADGGLSAAGLPTFWGDNVVYFGQADFVVRISRAHTRWLEVQSAQSQFAAPILELASAAPAGAQLVAAFRGASSVGVPAAAGWRDAIAYDAYGDAYTSAQLAQLGLPASLLFTPQFFPSPADRTWSSNVASLDGARFVQVRLSFIGNAVTGDVPVLDTLALAYRR